jgi:hypothetical protein
VSEIRWSLDFLAIDKGYHRWEGFARGTRN